MVGAGSFEEDLGRERVGSFHGKFKNGSTVEDSRKRILKFLNSSLIKK
jgi:hypothetical protein